MKDRINKGEKTEGIACPICKTSVKYRDRRGAIYKCPNCTAIFHFNKTIAKTSFVKGMYALSVVLALSGSVLGILVVAKWATGEGGFSGAKAKPELLIAAYGIILLSIVIGMILYSLGKMIEKSNIQKYSTIAQAKKRSREEALARKREEEEAKREEASEIESKEDSGLFSFVGEEYIDDIITVLKDEVPQTVALILGNIDDEIAKQILIELPLEMQKDVIIITSKLRSIDLKAVQELEKMLRQKLGIEEGRKHIKFPGIESAAYLLDVSPKDIQDKVLEQLAREDPDLSSELERKLFRFEDLERLTDGELLRVLQYIPPRIIAYAIKGIDKNLKDRILDNSSEQKQDLINDVIKGMPDKVLIRDVKAAQQKLIEVAQRMAKEGQITLGFDESEYI